MQKREYLNRATELRNHFKNEVSPKNLMSKRNVSKMFFIIVISTLLFACKQGGAKAPMFEVPGNSDEVKSNSVIVDTEIKLLEAIKNGKDKVSIIIPKGVVIRLNTCITIGEDKEITIEGKKNVTIEGNKSIRLFEILPGATLKIKNLILADGKSEEWGGAIYNTGWLFINDCTFRNNSAEAGGAIFNGKKGDTGGGLMIIGNSVFTENHANLRGGAIFNVSARSPAMIENSTFKNNTSYQGGAMYNLAGLLTINTSRFTGNKASDNGGALYNDKGYLLMDGRSDSKKSYLKNNYSENGGGAIHCKNGGVYLLHGYVLSENDTDGWGGAILNEESGSVHLLEVVVKGNKANKGNDVFNHSSGDKVIMDNAIVEKSSGNNFIKGKVDLSPFMRPE